MALAFGPRLASPEVTPDEAFAPASLRLEVKPAVVLKECGICTDDFPVGKCIAITPTEDVVCPDCFETGVEALFEAALLHEHCFPVRWGSVVLLADDFAEYLPSGFVDKMVIKQREYDTPVAERIYCRCSQFLGSRQPSGACSVVVCTVCTGSTCAVCSSEVSGSPSEHQCPDGTPDDRFQGFKQGKDYQLCPSCTTPVELWDGCNAMTCICSAYFCFICGMKTSPGETAHWTEGTPCPKWNQPGASNAQWLPDPELQRLRARIHDLWDEDPEASTIMDGLLSRLQDDAAGAKMEDDPYIRHLVTYLARALLFSLDIQYNVPVEEEPQAVHDEYMLLREALIVALTESATFVELYGRVWDTPGLRPAMELYVENHAGFLARLGPTVEIAEEWEIVMELGYRP